ncbi:hypothetical protein BWZ22_03330 [Seonamhaeicola sp. S2-3]|uniref:hypothetical protein n=1 Tax=Seonamhaeicola sp. S2-3 TaxID=1936081 RepID=UPI000972835C|nr:hypothetical protein [Seonamhaeicola sp. S2-3]APY10326.1 hypothetical protein BWZ22_03330 [Seonamhaeicola sp. S2-3]
MKLKTSSLLKLFFVLASIFFVKHNAFSQKREVLEKWVHAVEKEFPEIEWQSTQSKLRSGSYKYNLIRHHLLSDTYFVPAFGISIDKMSASKRNKVASKVNSYKRKSKYPWANRLDWYLWGALNQPRAYTKVLKEVALIHENRKNLKETTNKIISNNVSFNELLQIKSSVKYKYSKLLPSEINNLNNLIKEHERLIADNTLEEKMAELNNLSPSFQSVNKLESFRNYNRQLFSSASPKHTSQINSDIKQRCENMVAMLATKKQANLVSQNFAGKTISSINDTWNNLNASYKKYLYLPEVKTLLNTYRQKKTTYTANLKDAIINKAKTLYTTSELSSLLNKYTSNTNANTAIKTLTNYIEIRKTAIEQILKKHEEERRKKEAEKAAVIRTNKQLVAKLRRELRIQYESNLPTFEELHYILQSYLGLINPDGKYNINDAKRFVNLVEDKRYMRLRTNAISGDNETFQNSKGMKIKCSALTSVDGEDFAYTELIIPNVTRELFELYSKELTSEYRNILKNSMTPDIKPDKKDLYIKSGRTLYGLEIDDYGALVARAQRNNFANWPIMTERADYKTLKVSSFSNVTDVLVKTGQQITFKAWGKIQIGAFAGYASPSGINGFSAYNKVRNFKHGSLMGKIGSKGSWFYIGSNKTITANASGKLYLSINDKDVNNNNEGFYHVQYEIR